jgi:CBS domain-containing protein
VTISETLDQTAVSSLDLSRYVVVTGDTSVADTVRSMAGAKESCACVTANDTLTGVFTQRDFLTRVVGRPATWTRPITDQMAAPVQTIRADQSVADGLAVMNRWWVRSVPVLADGQLYGNLSFYTVMRLIADIVQTRTGDTSEPGVRHGFSHVDFTGLNTSAPVTVPSDETLDVVIHQMRARAIGSMFVVDERDNLVGVLTEFDLLTRFGCADIDLSAMSVSEVMTPEPVALAARSSIAEAIVQMATRGFSHIPLVGESGRPVGVASFRDVAAYFETSLATLA